MDWSVKNRSTFSFIHLAHDFPTRYPIICEAEMLENPIFLALTLTP